MTLSVLFRCAHYWQTPSVTQSQPHGPLVSPMLWTGPHPPVGHALGRSAAIAFVHELGCIDVAANRFCVSEKLPSLCRIQYADGIAAPQFRAWAQAFITSSPDHSEIKRDLYTANFVFVFKSNVPNELIPIKHSAPRSGNSDKSSTNLTGALQRGKTMDVYTHPVSTSERDAVSKLGEVLFPTIPNLHHNAAGTETGSTLTQ